MNHDFNSDTDDREHPMSNKTPEAILTTSSDGPKDDTVSRLLRVAGTRPAVPADHMAMAKAAARAQWQQTVAAEHQRRRFRRVGMGLLAAAALVAVTLGTGVGQRLFSGGSGSATATTVATLESLSFPGAAGVLGAGAKIEAGQIVETTEKGARIALRLADGASVRLDTDTRLRLDAADRLRLERGAVYIDAARGGSVAIGTPFGVARDIGTQFEVRLLGAHADGLRVRVREGEVVLERNGKSHTALAGDEVAVLADGTLARGTVANHGTPWSWLDEIRLPFDPESHSILEYLEWMAREKGWGLRFADPEIATQLAAIKPYGTLDGLSLEDAAEAWLAGAGLGYRLEDGQFLVTDAQE